LAYDHATHRITDDTPKVPGSGRAAHWVRRDLIAWTLPGDPAPPTYRLYAAPSPRLGARRRPGREGGPVRRRSFTVPARTVAVHVS
jgi:hypothetical protein